MITWIVRYTKIEDLLFSCSSSSSHLALASIDHPSPRKASTSISTLIVSSPKLATPTSVQIG
jgi:hypothetical protein